MESMEGTRARRAVTATSLAERPRGEALWTPVGDRATGGHAAELSAATS
jgi:hypothetical protein